MLKSGVALHQRPTTAAITRGNSGGNSVGANTKNIYISNGYKLSSIVPITTTFRFKAALCGFFLANLQLITGINLDTDYSCKPVERIVE
jgi:hypothetical protein